MSEKRLIIDQLRLNYSGLFNLGDMFRTIDAWFYEKGYDRHEKKNEEQILPSGRFVEIELRPWKKTTDYAKNEIRLRIFVKDMKDVEVEKDGVKLRLQQGDIHMIFDAFLETDYENRWESKPMFYFLGLCLISSCSGFILTSMRVFLLMTLMICIIGLRLSLTCIGISDLCFFGAKLFKLGVYSLFFGARVAKSGQMRRT